jgi:hypothetical protein
MAVTPKNNRANGWLQGAVNPLLRALEFERDRLSLDEPESPHRDTGNLGFRFDTREVRYLSSFEGYLTWAGKENLLDFVALRPKARPLLKAHDLAIKKVLVEVGEAFDALVVSPAFVAQVNEWCPKPTGADLVQRAAERIINRTRTHGALVPDSASWAPAFLRIDTVAGAVREYKKLLKGSASAVQHNEALVRHLHGEREWLADRFNLSIAQDAGARD